MICSTSSNRIIPIISGIFQRNSLCARVPQNQHCRSAAGIILPQSLQIFRGAVVSREQPAQIAVGVGAPQ